MSGETWRGWRERGGWGWCVHAGYGVCVTTGARNSVLRAACYGQCGRPSTSAVIKYGCIRFDSFRTPHHFIQASSSKAPRPAGCAAAIPRPRPSDARPCARDTKHERARGDEPRRQRDDGRRGHVASSASLTPSSCNSLAPGPVRTLVSRIKTTRTASHRMHCHLDMHLARLSPCTHARSAPP